MHAMYAVDMKRHACIHQWVSHLCMVCAMGGWCVTSRALACWYVLHELAGCIIRDYM